MADKRLDITAMGEEAPIDYGLRADEAIKAFDNIHSEDLDLDEATENRLLRKIDLIILPLPVRSPLLEPTSPDLCIFYAWFTASIIWIVSSVNVPVSCRH